MIIKDYAYGTFCIEEKVVKELLASKPLQRIKQISQQGLPAELDRSRPLNYSRYEHSVGVMLLLRKLGANEEEQLAGLLHDISHTPFSHTADMLFGSYAEQGLQDSLHESYFKNNEVEAILKRRGYDTSRISNPELFSLLERKSPDLCADRLDYSLRDLAYAKQIDPKEEVRHLLNLNGEIVFDSEEHAIKYGKLFIYLEREFYANRDNIARRYAFAIALKYALDKGIISKEELLFGVDKDIINKINDSGIREITSILNALRKDDFEVREGSLELKAKPRYVNPKFLDSGRISTAMEASPSYRELVENSIKEDTVGYRVKIRAGDVEIG
ncbi:MAG: HD domain-containing protein [Candidatus Micrarchaeia archaeon]